MSVAAARQCNFISAHVRIQSRHDFPFEIERTSKVGPLHPYQSKESVASSPELRRTPENILDIQSAYLTPVPLFSLRTFTFMRLAFLMRDVNTNYRYNNRHLPFLLSHWKLEYFKVNIDGSWMRKAHSSSKVFNFRISDRVEETKA